MSRVRHPPRIALNLAVGITGHRPPLLDPRDAARERDHLTFTLSTLAKSARAVGDAYSRLFDSDGFTPRLITPLAEGADQITAEVALELGYKIQALLPLPIDDYRTDFTPDTAKHFDVLLNQADSILQLPLQAAGRDAGYGLAGRATIAHCDILIALWDGEPARGAGGTAEVVSLALRQGIPVIHIPVATEGDGRVMWTGYGEFVDRSDLLAMPERPLDEETLHALIEGVLGPPADPSARKDLLMFLRESERRVRGRIEYPLMLALLGIRRLRRAAFSAPAYDQATRAEWQGFRDACADGRHGVAISLEPLERAFGWADLLAQHFAQIYRSGHVMNFTLAAAAVLMALAGMLFPSVHSWLAIGEPAAIALLVANTWIGTKWQWHRRWLEYRQLAERIRPMRSLKLLGIARPPISNADDFKGKIGWIDWYARGEWRRLGCPSGLVSDADALVRAISVEEIESQVAYHHASAHQMHMVDHRLHLVGMVLFALSILGCAAAILLSIMVPHFAEHNQALFVALSAGLPALGGAIFGIRMQGDFSATAERSLLTAQELRRIAQLLAEPGIGLARQTDLIEAAAAAMLSELGEWRRAYARRTLELA